MENKQPASWNALLASARDAPLNKACEIYDRILTAHPTCWQAWTGSIQAEMKARQLDQCATRLHDCLGRVSHIEIWNTYITFAKLRASSPQDLVKAYEFAVKHIGFALESGPLWLGWIHATQSLSTLEESEKMTRVRQLFQRAIVTPTLDLDTLWKEYDQFEHAQNKTLAQGLMSQFQPKYLLAKMCAKERWRKQQGLNWNVLSLSEEQIRLWKQILVYEKTNPLQLDPVPFRERVVSCFKQALACAFAHPAIWLDYAAFVGTYGDCRSVYKGALSAMPDTPLVHFLFAEYLEKRQEHTDAIKIYEDLIARLESKQKDSTLVYIHLMRATRRMLGVAPARGVTVRGLRSKHVTFRMTVAAAEMEWKCNKAIPFAQNMYHRGLNLFGKTEPLFAFACLDFFVATNDIINLRIVIERMLADSTQWPILDQRTLWDRFLEIEMIHGDLAAIEKAEQRRREALGEQESLQTQRFSFRDLLPCPKEWMVQTMAVVPLKPRPKFEMPRPDLLVPLAKAEPPRASSFHPKWRDVPEAIAQFAAKLPSAQTVCGPRLDPDLLLTPLKEMGDLTLRPILEVAEKEEEQTVPPVGDLYRTRMLARLE